MAYLTVMMLRVLLIVAAYPIIAQACGCLPMVPQERYCSAEVVLRITVESEEKIVIVSEGVLRRATDEEILDNLSYQDTMYRRYRYTTKQVVKGDNPKSRFAYTLYHDNMCGSTLDQGKYLIMGSTMVVDEKISLVFDSCSYAEKWHVVDGFTKKRILRRRYGDNCDCKITSCSEDGCTRGVSSDDECPLNFDNDDHVCYAKTLCKRNKEGVCEWKEFNKNQPCWTSTR